MLKSSPEEQVVNESRELTSKVVAHLSFLNEAHSRITKPLPPPPNSIHDQTKYTQAIFCVCG
jgi:hypothetical protein